MRFNSRSLFPGAVVVIIAVAVAFAVGQLKSHVVKQTINHLSGVNQKVAMSLDSEIEDVILNVKDLLLNQQLLAFVRAILDHSATTEVSFELRKIMAAQLFPHHDKGFYLIDKNKIIVGSMKDRDVGVVIPEIPSEAIDRLDQGEQGVVTHPFKFGQRIDMWVVIPVTEIDGSISGYLAVVLGDQHWFSTTTLLTGVASSTMETYLVNEQGVMLSESRFVDQLVKAGLLKPGMKSSLNVRVAELENNLMKGEKTEVNRDKMPLTLAVQSVLESKRDGFSSVPFRDYRGASVMGVWQWSKPLNAAIITEIDIDDALADYYFARDLLALLVLIIVAGGLISAMAYSRLRVKSEREANRHRNLLLESTAEAIYGMDIDAKCTFVNQAFLNMLGYEEDEVIGKNIHKLIHHSLPDGSPLSSGMCSIIRAHRERTRIYRNDECFWHKDGRSIHVEYWAHPLFEGDVAIGSVVTFLDISDKLKAERERNQLEKQVQHTQRLESLGVLAGGIAHDFNNLLAAILGNASLVDAGILKDPLRAKERNGRIVQAAERAATLCKQMLAYSGKGQFVLKELDVSAIVDEMTHLLEVSIDKSTVIKYPLTQSLPLVIADEAQIQQVIMNLVTNANEAIDNKSGVIALTTGMMYADRNFLLDCYGDQPEAGRFIYVEVSDTGCGMDKETIEKIFDPFYTTKVTGHGLGMSAILGIVRGHKGALKIYSEPGRGTTFKLLLPISESSTLMMTDETLETMGRFDGGTVLVVDDEETVREMSCAMLEEMGFETMTACNGEEGLARYKKHQSDITLILTDLTMPRMSGNELFSAIKKMNPDCRIILSSGYNSQDAIQQFSGKGLAGFVQKPYTPQTLEREIRKVLGDKK